MCPFLTDDLLGMYLKLFKYLEAFFQLSLSNFVAW